MYLKKILGISLLLLSTACLADTVDLNITSWHADKSYNYNSDNYGIGYTRTINHHWSYKGGVYNNSFSKTSLYGGVGLYHKQRNWSFGADILIVTGYDNISKTTSVTTCEEEEHEEECTTKEEWNGFNNLSQFQPVIIPTFKVHFNERHSLNIGIIPISIDDLKGDSQSTRKRKPIEALTFQYSYTL